MNKINNTVKLSIFCMFLANKAINEIVQKVEKLDQAEEEQEKNTSELFFLFYHWRNIHILFVIKHIRAFAADLGPSVRRSERILENEIRRIVNNTSNNYFLLKINVKCIMFI